MADLAKQYKLFEQEIAQDHLDFVVAKVKAKLAADLAAKPPARKAKLVGPLFKKALKARKAKALQQR